MGWRAGVKGYVCTQAGVGFPRELLLDVLIGLLLGNTPHPTPSPIAISLFFTFAPPQQGPNTIGGSESLLHHFDFGNSGGGAGTATGTNLSRSSSVMIRHTTPSLSAKSSFHRRRVRRSVLACFLGVTKKVLHSSTTYQPNQTNQHYSQIYSRLSTKLSKPQGIRLIHHT